MRGRGAAVATLILSLAIAAGALALPSDPELGSVAADGPVTLSASRAGCLARAARTPLGVRVIDETGCATPENVTRP